MFSIVIPTMQKNIKVFNMLLDELVSDDYIGEIIIIDNSLLGIKYKSDKIKVITPSENIYVNPAWNLGVKDAKYEYIGILNDDLIFPKNFFEFVHKFMENQNNIGYIGLDAIPKTNDELFLNYPNNTELKFFAIEERNNCWGSAFFFKKSNYFKIPEELKVWCGDDYIFYKSIDNGLTNYAISNSNIMHLHSLTSDRKEFDKIKYEDQKKYKEINPKYNLIQEPQAPKCNFWQKIFSMQNYYSKGIKRKIITILGFKIKINIEPKMKLGIAYNLFDGEELLEYSLKSIRNAADFICVIYQKKSYYNVEANPNIENLLKKLMQKKLIDEIYLYDKDFSKYSDKTILEKEKRNIGLKICKKHNMSHYLNLDVDEFYDAYKINRLKNFIISNKINSTACSIYEYIKSPEYRLINSYTYSPTKPYNFYVPFIMKIHKFKNTSNKNIFPTLVDPTRSMNNNETFYLFPIQDIVMHHMCTIRKNLNFKYKNSTYNQNQQEILKIQKIKNDILNWKPEENKLGNSDYYLFNGNLVEKVDNKYNIQIADD